jgi:hypothetical protein
MQDGFDLEDIFDAIRMHVQEGMYENEQDISHDGEEAVEKQTTNDIIQKINFLMKKNYDYDEIMSIINSHFTELPDQD